MGWNEVTTFPWEAFLCSLPEISITVAVMASSPVSPWHLLRLLGNSGEEPLLGNDGNRLVVRLSAWKEPL